ncbi:MAG: hypothetical protein HQL87_17280 [Magnetococcales bacterium]|nr:hypothetical protein [Magnetococcales bacterium]
MKKSLVLGAAALATLFLAAPQDSKASEVKIGGYYMFRMQDTAINPFQNPAGIDDQRFWAQRLWLNMDFIADKTTHAHLVTRVLDSNIVQGAETQLGSNFSASGLSSVNTTTASSNPWSIRKAWLETEAAGVGVKVGNMPLSLNDGILVNNDDTGFGAVMLSKTFGDVTVALADVRVAEGNIGAAYNSTATGASAAIAAPALGGTATNGSNDDNVDLYVLALFGKVSQVNYGVTGAYLKTGDSSGVFDAWKPGAFWSGTSDAATIGTVGHSISDGWLALTLNSVLGGVDVTGTGIWETGMSGVNPATLVGTTASTITGKKLDGSGGLFALRLKGNLPGVAQGATWNAYGSYASADFTNITSNYPKWSQTWDMEGAANRDLLMTWAAAAGASPTENMRTIGVGLTIPVQNWTINPMLDYAHVNDDSIAGGGKTDFRTTSAWGGGVQLLTKLNPATTLSITGLIVDPNDTGNGSRYGAYQTATAAGPGPNVTPTDTMHMVEASLKMVF